jgi:hypothetical protein
MQKKLLLNKILKIKEDLEESIRRDDYLIQGSNSIIAENKRDIDIREVEKLRDKKEDQLVELKLIIQEANMKKHRDGNSNFYYVYVLSNLKRLKGLYIRLNTTNGLKESKKGTINYSAEITADESNKKILEINKKIQDIEIKLATFNQNTEVKVSLDPDLNLV